MSADATAKDSGAAETAYVPPKVWKEPQPPSETGNRATAGSRTEKVLPKGKSPLQLHSMATPNGVKITIMLEELVELNPSFEYDAWPINIMKGDQFSSGFVAVNPNSKIPALADYSGASEGEGGGGSAESAEPLHLFESGSILIHLATKHGGEQFFPTDYKARVECLNWLFWQVGSAPYLGGGFGHFYAYAKEKQEYPINRFAMESKRQLDVLNKQLETHKYIAGDQYTIADMAIWPWYGGLVMGELYGTASEFLNIAEEYPHVIRWAKLIWERPAVKRGKMVNRAWGHPATQVIERHSRADFEGKEWEQ